MQRFFHVSNFIISRSIEFCLEFRVTVFKSRVTGSSTESNRAFRANGSSQMKSFFQTESTKHWLIL